MTTLAYNIGCFVCWKFFFCE